MVINRLENFKFRQYLSNVISRLIYMVIEINLFIFSEMNIVVPKPSGKLGRVYCGCCEAYPGIPTGDREWTVAIAMSEASRLPRYLGS